MERYGWSVDITPAGGRDDGRGTVGGVEICLPPLEHGHTVNYDQAHCGPVSGDGAETGAKDIQEVVGTGRGGCGRDADGGLGSRTDKRGEGYGQEG